MIYKGCEKRMIMLKNTGSELFEEAYFIINNKRSSQASTYDMIKEANRIVAENDIIPQIKEKQKKPIFFYILGIFSGMGTMALVMSFFI
ncbi:MAG: hypothetical protein IJB24_07795 [Clostridia bacterium]|nr:hypothetical protein [Clostridia bacterium]MBQ4602747.1 hypothetical protein [Clostridia bacterium]